MRQPFAHLHPRTVARGLMAVVVITLLASSLSLTLAQDATPALRTDYWPTEDWQTSTPEEQQMDSQVLADMLAAVTTTPVNLHSLLVIRHGYIVSETYYPPYTATRKHEVYSVTKSVVSTLAGIAVDQGYISSLDQPVLDFFPDRTFENVDDRKKAMTLRHLITMQSGLDWDDSKENGINAAKDWVAYVLNTPMRAEPGTKFVYCTGCSHVVSAIIQQATSTTKRGFADKVLFDPLGISDILWKIDPQDISAGGTGLRLRPRDMAKIGYLFLHNGEWDGQNIISPEWVQAASTEQVNIGVIVGTGSALNYGLMWWTYPQLNAYAALGYNGQTVFVIPDLDLLIVTTAATVNHEHDEIFDLIETYIIPAVQDLPDGFLSS